MQTEIKWRFPSNDYGEIKGWNDSGMEHFTNNVIASLAREICQNSLDAQHDHSKAVRVDFSLFELACDDIPGRDYLKSVFYKLDEYWSELQSNKAKDICRDALKALSSNTCKILRISDFNTTGLTGVDNIRNSNWHNLVKASGLSDKSIDAAGSFGIGKYAPYVCSDVRTVFYSTYNNEEEYAYEGVSRLATFESEPGKTTQGTGYYACEYNKPVKDVLCLDPNFSRENGQYGTDIYILAYNRCDDDWVSEIEGSVLDGFFFAIMNNQLSVSVNGEVIDANSMESVIANLRENSPACIKTMTNQYYQSLKHAVSEKLFFKKDIKGGTLSLWLRNNEDSEKKGIAMIRKSGMKIYDETRCFGPLNVSGVCYIEGTELNKYLRELENTRHDCWEVSKVKSNKSFYKALVSEIKDFIKNTIMNEFASSVTQSIDAAGVGAFLPDVYVGEEKQTRQETISDKIENIERKEIKKKTSVSSTSSATKGADNPAEEQIDTHVVEDDEGENDFFPHPNNRKKKHEWPSPDPVPSTPDEDGSQTKKISQPTYKGTVLQKFIPICISPSKGEYCLIVTPANDSKNGMLKLFISAEVKRYEAPIIEVQQILPKAESVLEVTDNQIKGLTFEKDKTIRLRVVLDYQEICSLEVETYAIED